MRQLFFSIGVLPVFRTTGNETYATAAGWTAGDRQRRLIGLRWPAGPPLHFMHMPETPPHLTLLAVAELQFNVVPKGGSYA